MTAADTEEQTKDTLAAATEAASKAPERVLNQDEIDSLLGFEADLYTQLTLPSNREAKSPEVTARIQTNTPIITTLHTRTTRYTNTHLAQPENT
mgnify:CR=1 FL=1